MLLPGGACVVVGASNEEIASVCCAVVLVQETPLRGKCFGMSCAGSVWCLNVGWRKGAKDEEEGQ
jgi:hypothetical protein